MKHIGKPCAGKPLARFDERGQVSVTMIRLMRHRQTKGAETDRPGLPLRDTCSLLYRTGEYAGRRAGGGDVEHLVERGQEPLHGVRRGVPLTHGGDRPAPDRSLQGYEPGIGYQKS